MERRDVAVAAEDARLAEVVPVDPVVEPRGAVAALQAEDHVDAGLGQRPLDVGGALLVGPGEVPVDAAVVGPEDEVVALALEVGGRLLDPRAHLRRARRRDDGDRGAVPQRRGLGSHAGSGLDGGRVAITSTR
jgi:hypothetical protein